MTTTPTLDPRTSELLDRVTSSTGPVASALSASEWHELRDELETFRYNIIERARDASPAKPAAFPVTMTNFNHLVRQLHDKINEPLSQTEIDVFQIICGFATEGPWVLATSNSWRRISTDRGDGDVLYGVTAADGQSDLVGPNVKADLMFMVAARTLLPRAILTIKHMGIDMHGIAEFDAAEKHRMAREHAEVTRRIAREHKDEIDRLNAELKAARELAAECEQAIDSIDDGRRVAEKSRQDLLDENARLRKLQGRLVEALEEARHG